MLVVKQLWHLFFHLSEGVMQLFVVQHRWKGEPVPQRTQTSCSLSGQGRGVIYSSVSDPSLNFLWQLLRLLGGNVLFPLYSAVPYIYL